MLIAGAAASIFALFFSGSDSDDDSSCEPDASIHSAETGGDGFFDDESLASGDLPDVFGQPRGRPGDERAVGARSSGSDSGSEAFEEAEIQADHHFLTKTSNAAASAAAIQPTGPCPPHHIISNLGTGQWGHVGGGCGRCHLNK